MQKYLQITFKNDFKNYELLKENSFYFKSLNRGTIDYKGFVQEMKLKYKTRLSDKLESLMDNMELVSSVLNVLK